jgi:meso-butanediol dehydrogenase/(S,S)-butanediol dehydrogenase/diacetyl reductase
VTPSVLITGGGTGIGAAAARALAARGYGVCLTGRRPEPLQALADELGGLAVVADTADAGSITGAVARAVEHFGRLDALVVSAGTGAAGTVTDQSLERWNAVLATNLTGAFLACQAALPHIVEARGSVVTVSSLAGLRAGPAAAAYSASKAGLIMLTRSMALDYGPLGVRANCVCPGWIRTAMADREMDGLATDRGTGTREDAYTLATGQVPTRRPGTAEEAGETVAWLASPASSYVNGAVLAVDGGASIVDVATLAFARPTP